MKPDRIGGEIQRELKRFGPAAGMAELVAAWPEAVGRQIAQNAWPARFARDGTLHVATSSSAWAFELSQFAPRIAAQLAECLGEHAPQQLRFAPGKLPETSADDVKGPGKVLFEPRPEDVEMATALTAAIEDEDLRKVVAKTAAQSLARAAAARSV